MNRLTVRMANYNLYIESDGDHKVGDTWPTQWGPRPIIAIEELPSVSLECQMCSEIIDIGITEEQLDEWMAHRGELPPVHLHFPLLPADEREMLISGVCGDCFDLMYPEELR